MQKTQLDISYIYNLHLSLFLSHSLFSFWPGNEWTSEISVLNLSSKSIHLCKAFWIIKSHVEMIILFSLENRAAQCLILIKGAYTPHQEICQKLLTIAGSASKCHVVHKALILSIFLLKAEMKSHIYRYFSAGLQSFSLILCRYMADVLMHGWVQADLIHDISSFQAFHESNK